MRILIVEDDFISRKVMLKLLSEFGSCDVAVDGVEAVSACELAWESGTPYDVLFLDIMMPNMSGDEALKRIRARERELGISPAQEVKVIMTSALDDPKTVTNAFYQGGATSYLVKPVERRTIVQELRSLELI